MEPIKPPHPASAGAGTDRDANIDDRGFISNPGTQLPERRSTPRTYDDGNEYEVDPLGDEHDYPTSSSDLFYEG
jgi:hypothetical protein